MHSFIQGIKNLIYWFKVIWEDRDFDYGFIYILLHHKLRRMSNGFKEWGHSTDSAKLAEEMAVAAEVCKRLINNEYNIVCFEEYDAKYLEEDNPYMWSEEQVDGTYLCKFTEDQEQRELFRACSQRVDEMQEQDRKFLFSFLSRNIEKWWD